MKTGLIVLIVIAIFGILVLLNSSPVLVTIPIPQTDIQPTDEDNAWQAILSEGFGNNSTPLPTIAIPTREFVVPTLNVNILTTSTPFNASDVNQTLSKLLRS